MGAASTIAAKVRWRPLREGHGPRLSRRATVARPEDRRRRRAFGEPESWQPPVVSLGDVKEGH